MKPSLYLPVFIILATGLLSGCAGTMPGIRDQTVRQDNQILMEKNREVTNFWTGKDLTLAYKYRLTGQNLKISGTIILSKHLTHYTVMDRLGLYLYFVDARGKTVGQNILYTAPFRRWIPMLNLDFSRQLRIPPEAEAMAFTYIGKVSDGMESDDGGISWDFWNAL